MKIFSKKKMDDYPKRYVDGTHASWWVCSCGSYDFLFYIDDIEVIIECTKCKKRESFCI